ncbi:predicted protein [Phaeodactylum tricornutum CCAP 1055/1]|jgi:hypothetical protein|uniref:Uncharacterized protein n=1 Tax=Phaeodactylum tricornutum (strain CCAP 1055/1) TaxID=556484 RepID=B5Y3U7_PHATC|nr:predicted protein [Phaeodactylum tricornutum CCAP 1055/1]ACI65371.1 predicted protein [Phaeodactylum tricornutum CCAP 1055/1]|eukprot:XP_002185901.1 predicted protein [Phaeodactylum tricornutum CCAP 1055/1]
MPKSPAIYRLAANRQYDAVSARVKSHPQDLMWTDRHGSTALHILCQARIVDGALLDAVQSILQVSPEQVAWGNVGTWTPLHFAVEPRLLPSSAWYTRKLILRLIEACPEAVSVPTKNGFKTRTPFHIACEANADIRVLKAMLAIDPSLATRPFVKFDAYSVTENPLQLVWKNRNKGFAHAATAREEKMALLLHAAYHGTVPTSSRQQPYFRLLTAACTVRCPRDYFTQILCTHIGDVSKCDALGNFPLHYAVASAVPEGHVYTQFVIQALLSVSTYAASQPNADGRWPLHVAVYDTHLTWHKGGVRELAFAFPEALRKVDVLSGLVPFLASAERAVYTRLNLSTTYELLLAAPEMVQAIRKTNRIAGLHKEATGSGPVFDIFD